MSKELQAQYTTGKTLYAVVLNATGSIWNTSTPGFETPAIADWSAYKIAAPEQGTTGLYEGNMPAVPAAEYGVLFYLQVGGSPAPTDPLVGEGSINWNGTAEIANADTVDPYLAARVYGNVDPIDSQGRQVFRSPPNALDGGGVAKVRFDPTTPRGGRLVELDPSV